MQRVLVTGTPGSGKTSLARVLASRLGLPHYELDALHHGPGWTKRPEFEDDVRAFAQTGSWVTEDQYHRFLDDLLWERADTVVWLDLPRHVVIRRLLRRSFGRALSRTELWSGNREDWRHWLDTDHPMRWTWDNFERRLRDTAERVRRHAHIDLVRLTRPGQVDRWIRAAPFAPQSAPGKP